MSMVDTLKKISKTAGEAGAPMQIMFGTVTSESPLAVLVENRLPISGEMLIVPKHLRAGYLDTHKHRLVAAEDEEPETGDVKEPEEGGTTSVEAHTHTLGDDYWTNNEGNTLKDREYYYGLKAGEAVILLRDAGGQRFLIVGRL